MSQELTVNLRISIDTTKIPESLDIALAILEGISQTSGWKKIQTSNASDTITVYSLYSAISCIKCLRDDYHKWLTQVSGETNLF